MVRRDGSRKLNIMGGAAAVAVAPDLDEIFGSDLFLWYKRSSGITTDTGGVSQWDDATGNGWDISQSESSLRPELQTADLNGEDTILFDWPGGDFLGTLALGASFVAKPFMLGWVVKNQEVSDTGEWLGPEVNRGIKWVDPNWIWTGNGNDKTIGAPGTTDWHTLVFYFNSFTDGAGYMDGVKTDMSDLNYGATLSNITLAARDSGISPIDCTMAEFFLCDSASNFTEDDVTSVLNKWNQVFGFSHEVS